MHTIGPTAGTRPVMMMTCSGKVIKPQRKKMKAYL